MYISLFEYNIHQYFIHCLDSLSSYFPSSVFRFLFPLPTPLFNPPFNVYVYLIPMIISQMLCYRHGDTGLITVIDVFWSRLYSVWFSALNCKVSIFQFIHLYKTDISFSIKRDVSIAMHSFLGLFSFDLSFIRSLNKGWHILDRWIECSKIEEDKFSFRSNMQHKKIIKCETL